MAADSEPRQGVLAIVSANLTVANYTLVAAKAKLDAARNLKIKGQVKQLKPIRCSEITLSWPAGARNPRI